MNSNIGLSTLKYMIDSLEPTMYHFDTPIVRNNCDLLLNIFHLNLAKDKLKVNINNILMQFDAEDYWIILNDNEITLGYMCNNTPVFDPFLNFIHSYYISKNKSIMVIDPDDMEICNTQWKLNKVLYREIPIFNVSTFEKVLYVPMSVIRKIDLIQIANFFKKLFDSSNVNVLI